MQLLLLSLALFLLGAVDFALPRCRASPLFARAAGDAGFTNTAAAPPLLAISETALISVDLGQESMKVSAWRVQQQAPHNGMAEGGDAAAATSTGSVTMVLNDQANRKSPPCVAFRYFRDPVATAGSGGVSTDASPSGRGDGEQPPAHRPYTALHPRGYQLERAFAEQAQALAPRFPEQVVCSAAQLLGCTAASTNAATVESRACALTSEQLTTAYSCHVVPLTALRSTGTTTANIMDKAQQPRDSVVGRQALGAYVPFYITSNAPGQQWRRAAGDHSTGIAAAAEEEGVLFSSEELTAMLLGHARRMAEKTDAADNALSEEDQRLLADMRQNAGSVDAAAGETRASATVRYAALTVPAHATVAQRQALVDAAALAGLRVVRLVHSTAGAAVQLAYLKAEQVLKADKVQYVMIYDMGSRHAEVAIYSLAALPASVASRAGLQGDVEMQALVGSRTLGGAAFDECIANHWDARYFGRRVMNGVLAAAGGRDAGRREAARERGSLLRAAQRAKEMLSANTDAHVTIDGVRADPSYFDAEWCRPLFDAAVALRDEAIAATGGVVKSLGALDRFEVIGGGTRVPRLLQRLGEGYRSGVVDRTLNSDEAAVMGTTLLAVSSAPRTLGLHLGQALPRYHVREWLTSAVYASMELHSTGIVAAAAPSEVQILFAARKTTLPATRSVRVRLPDVDVSPADKVVITLYSGAEADSAYAHSMRSGAAVAAGSARAAASPTSMANCTGCYVRTCTVEGVRKAAEQLLAPYTQQKTQHGSARPRREHVRLAGAEVVVEVVATVSGIPHCSVAYLRAEVEEAGVDPDAAEDRDEPGEGVRDKHEMNANEEKVKHTDARVTAKGTADPTTVDATATATPPQVQVHVIALSLRVSSGAATAGAAVHGPRYNMDFAELTFSHRRVRQLQALDDVRLRRSTLRNEIESVLVWIKENNPTWDAEDVQGDASPSSLARRTWRTTVREVGGWLDNFGDTASATALEERLRIISGVKAALREAA
ncbi:Hsp70 family protein [Leishmania donovani]|uniref:Hsp70 family protein n=1 Tax=Leishmania donovani TaxID=5661 RepID=A0A504YA75_LEIDO|nr:Hsp70 family protein [Leishmania donovani]